MPSLWIIGLAAAVSSGAAAFAVFASVAIIDVPQNIEKTIISA